MDNSFSIVSRQKAKALGLKYYYTGKPCKRNHISKRCIDGSCYECKMTYNKCYYEENTDKVLHQHAQLRANNPELSASWNRNYYNSNRESIRLQHNIYYNNNIRNISLSHKGWRMKNPAKRISYDWVRKGKSKQAIPKWYEPELIEQIYNKRNELSELWGITLQVDHIIPINPKCKTVCGLHCWANLQLLENSLNSSKGSTYQTDW